MRRLDMRASGGFTLIELVIVSMLLTVVIGAIAYAFYDLLQTSAITRVRMQMQQDIRDTLGYMSRMVRYAGIQPVEAAVEVAEPDKIVFQGDYNDDEVVDRISFSYDSGAKAIVLTQWLKDGMTFVIVHESQIVMANVVDLQFTYYTARNVVTTDSSRVTAVKIALTLEPPPNVSPKVRNAVGEMKKSTMAFCPNLAWRLDT